MHAGRRDEDGDQQQHPPQEGDYEEQDGEVARESHTPKIVRRDLGQFSRSSTALLDEIRTAGSSGSR